MIPFIPMPRLEKILKAKDIIVCNSNSQDFS